MNKHFAVHESGFGTKRQFAAAQFRPLLNELRNQLAGPANSGL